MAADILPARNKRLARRKKPPAHETNERQRPVSRERRRARVPARRRRRRHKLSVPAHKRKLAAGRKRGGHRPAHRLLRHQLPERHRAQKTQAQPGQGQVHPGAGVRDEADVVGPPRQNENQHRVRVRQRRGQAGPGAPAQTRP
ncbi:hypothetical protein BpHYR1_013876, partial [Brachionus plicatilis]